MSRQLDRLAERILKKAKAAGLQIVTAESCTAGTVAHVLSKGEGASKHLAGGFVTYTKDMKSRVLGVPMAMLKSKSAVAAEIAEAMARGALARSGASIAVAVTGVAGPDPDEDGNPVGLIYCAVVRRGQAPRSVRLQSTATQRRALIDEATLEALTLLRGACED